MPDGLSTARVLIRQLQGRLRTGAETVAVPASAAGALVSVTVTHDLGVTPSGGLYCIMPGGSFVGNFGMEAINALTDTTMSVYLRNNAGGALGVGTIRIAWHVWP